MAKRMIDNCTPAAQRLGCLDQLRNLHDVIDHGTSAQRQRQVWDRTGDARSVVDFLLEQSRSNVLV
jgi:carboxylate-amine ligase